MLKQLADKPIRKRDVAAFFLLPQFKYSFRHLTGAYYMLVNLLAVIFVQAGLIDPNHPAQRTTTVQYYTIKWLIGEAWYNLRISNSTRPDQWGLFIGVIAMLGLIILTVFTLILKIAFGTVAHAQLFSHPTTPTSPPPAFHPDIAQDILNNVLRLGAENLGNGLQAALGPALQLYSNAIMVIAAFIVFWIVVSLVADTARTGQLGGGRNMVWTPIRLVVALGLMVPFGTGFNTGQHIVLKFAEWGSNLGTNVWAQYVTAIIANTNMIGVTPQKDVLETIGKFGEVLVCRDAMNLQYMHFNGGVIPPNLLVTNLYPNVSNTNGLVDANGNPLPAGQITVREVTWGNNQLPAACGSIKFPQVDTTGTLDPTGVATGGNGVEAITTRLRRGLLTLWTPAANTPPAPLIGLGPNPGFTVQQALDPYACLIAAAEFPEIDAPPNPGTTAGACLNTGGLVPTPPATNWYNNINPVTGGKYPDTALTVGPILNAYMAAANALIGVERTNLINAIRAAAGATNIRVSSTSSQTGASATPPPSQLTLVREVSEIGWGGMGVWYHTIARMNRNFKTASAALPDISGPNLSGAGGGGGSVPTVYQRAQQAIDSYNAWWNNGAYSNSLPANDPYYQQQSRSFSSINALQGGMSTQDVRECLEWKYAEMTIWGKTVELPFPVGLQVASMAACAAEYGFAVTGQWLYSAFNIDSDTYPIAQLQQTGETIWDWAIGAILVVSMASFVPTMNVIGAPVFGLLSTLAFVMLGAAAALIWYIPLVPFLRSVFALLAWIFIVFEAVVAAPLWALAHLSTDGDGLAGSRAAQGYCFMLHLLIRPSMVVFGFIGSLLIFDAMVRMMNSTFIYVILGTQGNPGFFDWIVYTAVYVFFIYTLVNSTFKIIDVLPDAVMKWINCPASGMPQETGENVGEFAIAATNIGGRAAGDISGLGRGVQQYKSDQKQSAAAAEERTWRGDMLNAMRGEGSQSSAGDFGGSGSGGGYSNPMLRGMDRLLDDD